jgi:hypothetical protein
MRLRLFARGWRTRKRAAAAGVMPTVAEPGIRPPVSVGSHRRTGRFRAPGRPRATPRPAVPGPAVAGSAGAEPAGAGSASGGSAGGGRADARYAGVASRGAPAPGRAAEVAGRPAAPRGPIPPPGPASRATGDLGSGPATPAAAPRPGTGRPVPARTDHRRWGGLARVAVRTAAPASAARAPSAVRPAAPTQARPAARAQPQATATAPPKLAWYEIAEGNRTAAGWRDCGSLEAVLHREWSDTETPPAEAVTAIDRLADLPRLIKDRLVAGLDAIHVGGGGVPDLDDMGRLSGVPLPSGRATWDACAGAYGERKIIVGSRPSPTPDVMCHEVGHALDDIDGPTGHWQSDSDEFCALYDQCSSHLASNLHRQRGILGRREFFADAFAAIASRQRPALVDMLGGDTRTALNVMLYFNMRYGI